MRLPAGRPALLAALLAAVALPTAPVSGAADGIEGRTLTIQQCVALGLRQNPATEIARQGLAAARAKVGEAKAGRYPSFKVTAGYTYTALPAAGAAPSPDMYDNRVSLRQVLYDGGQTSSLVAGTRLGIGAQESELQRTGLDVAANVRTAFFEVLRRRDLIEVAAGALSSAEKHVEQAQALHREGVAPRSDVIRADVQVAAARLEVIRAEHGLLLAKAGLTAAMGLPVTTGFDVAAPEAADEAPVPSLAEALAGAPAQRPELAAVKARQEAADAAVRQARGGLLPTVSVDAAYGWQGSDFAPLDTKWSVGVSVGVPVFERRVAKARVGQAVAVRGSLAAVETQTLRAVELEVEQAWLLLQEARERQVVAAKTRELAEESIRVSEGRYQEGLGTMLEVIDARTALTQAGTNVVVARYDSAQARARLDRALGRGLPEEAR